MRTSPRRFAAFFLLALSCACSKEQPATEPYGEEVPLPHAVEKRPAPRFYYDLGPETVDVSAYPRRQQENYKLFLAVCGTCHGTARPLHAPYADAATWKRYVRRMHVKMESQSVLPSPDDERRILDFLVYDSKVRKTAKREEFQAQQEKLKKIFEKTAKDQPAPVSTHPKRSPKE